MLRRIKRAVVTWLLRAGQGRLPAPTPRETALIDDLRRAFRALSITVSSEAGDSLREWSENANRLRHLVLTKDPRSFLRWDVIRRTMFVTDAPYVGEELSYLKHLPDWHERWCRAIKESPGGCPTSYVLYPASSENLIHHAYHLARFEEQTHRRVDDLACVLEFGGGYGSMCRLFHNLGFRGRYLIFDLPAFSALQRFFLRSIGMCVGSPDEFRDRSSGVALSSNVGDLHTLVADGSDNGRALFLATWSISEAPIALRDAVLRLVSGFGALFIAYQRRFGGVDNLEYFRSWKRATGERVRWHEWEIDHLPGNYYLVGTDSISVT